MNARHIVVCLLTAMTARSAVAQYVVFEHSEMLKLASDHVPSQQTSLGPVSCALACGETKSLQLGVHAQADAVKNVRITVESDLDVEVFHEISPETKKKLIDTDMSWLSWMPDGVYLQPGEVVAELAAGKSVGFFLNLRAAPEARAGAHAGRIRFEVDNQPAVDIELTVTVRPFELTPPRIAFGMYHAPSRLPKRLGGWGIRDDTALAVYRDMVVHGHNSVEIAQAGSFSQLPPRNRVVKEVKLARQANLMHREIPCMMISSNIEANSPRPSAITWPQAVAAADWLKAQHAEHGWPEMLLYGWDEPPYPAHGMGVPGLRGAYVPLRDLPIRVVTALNKAAAYGHGDVFDVWAVLGGEITPAMRAEAARLGAEVWTYSYRIWRENFKPLRQRYYAGLYTWAHELGGNYVWAYGHGHHGHVWFEPDGTQPLPVIGWEARREGVSDYRYLQMVEDRAAGEQGDVAKEAAAWLAQLRARLLPTDPHLVEPGQPLALDEYEAIRRTASRYIEQLGPVADRAPEPPPSLKDEASPFRGKTVEQCIAALKDADAATRRAAAWALYEMGAQAAPAVSALAAALGDEQVRFPALRALESIGSAAYPAATKVTALLDHDDAFVRLGATYALAGIARSTSWDADLLGYDPDQVPDHASELVPIFQRAIGDPSVPVTLAGAYGLFLCGEACEPLLDEALAIFIDKQRVKRDSGTGREAALRIMAGAGPRSAASANVLGQLIKTCDDRKGRDMLVALTLAAMGPGAAEAIPVLEKHATPENSELAATHYALLCLRGDPKDLYAIAEILFDEKRPHGDRRAAARFLIALGGKAAPVADLMRQRVPDMDVNLRFKHILQPRFFERVEQNAPALRLLQR